MSDLTSTLFVTGIDTEVGKTVCSAILTEALQTDYWKPIQSGDLHHTDTDKIREWTSITEDRVHPEAYRLTQPLSPHASAEKDGIEITLSGIQRPSTSNHLLIEGAGGLMVPINNKNFIFELIQPQDTVILVSRHKLGSINHTLLSLEKLKTISHKQTYVLFVGEENKETESIINQHTNAHILGRIDPLKTISKESIYQAAQYHQKALSVLLQ